MVSNRPYMANDVHQSALEQAPLGKKTNYINHYSPDLLFPLARKVKRDEIQVSSEDLPFKGYDIWNAFELSWLNSKGKPVVALGEFKIPCESPCLIESKSFKLYLNSFNNSKFESIQQVSSLMQYDLSGAAGSPVQVKLIPLNDGQLPQIGRLNGNCLDDLDIECNLYQPSPDLLSVESEVVEEVLMTHLLKSNCLVTGQPDWGSLQIEYRGHRISHDNLLRYVVSLRDHNEFHEQCVERIFMDISRRCNPERLSVYARYTRRGGLDINPFRTNSSVESQFNEQNVRLARQ